MVKRLAAIAMVVLTACGSSGSVRSTTTSSPTGPSSSSVPATGAADWATYHRDSMRRGSIAGGASTLQRAWISESLDGAVYAEPLIVGDRVFAATNGGTVVAMDATNGQTVWRTHLGDPIPRSRLPCGNVDPTGVLSTPVIDAAAGVLYAVAFVQPGTHELVALDTSTGAVKFRRPVDPPGADPLVHQQRGALALGNGRVYVPFGGLYGDCGDYRGAVVGVPTSGTGEAVVYQVPTSREAGIWAPQGPSITPAGDVFVSTGNAERTDVHTFGDSVIKLSRDLQVVDWFAPTNWAQLSRGDIDLGSTTAAVLDNDLVFQAGKQGVGYLLRASNLGHIGGQIFQAQVCRGAFGGTAYAPPLLFVPCVDGLYALRIGSGSFEVAWHTTFRSGGPIVVGDTVFALDLDSGHLHGLAAETGALRIDEAVGQPAQFSTPSAAAGRLFVAADRKVIAFSTS